MRVLWLCNIMLPVYARAHGLPVSNREGWLTGSFRRIAGLQAEETEGKRAGAEGTPASGAIELAVCFPAPPGCRRLGERLSGVRFYGFAEDTDRPEIYDAALERRLRVILDDFRPDIVHIFGTEFPHAAAMLRAFQHPERTLVGLQGFCSIIAERYMADLPPGVVYGATFRDRVRKDSLTQQQEKFRLRGEREKEAIRLTGHVAGRTRFDRTAAEAIHPGVRYHFLNETMRPCFYTGRWRPAGAVPHSIFLSQGDYPLKGFHYMLEAMPRLLKKYPDARLYVAGNSVIGGDGGGRYPLFLRIGAYGKYLRSLIRRYGLQGRVTVLGKLTAEEMKRWYLRSSVFVCPSVLENSPNSVAEAMLLGMPVAASRVGGIPDMLEEGVEGLLFAPGDVKALADAVLQLWDEDVIAGVYGENARRRAMKTHDPEANYAQLLEIYRLLAAEP